MRLLSSSCHVTYSVSQSSQNNKMVTWWSVNHNHDLIEHDPINRDLLYLSSSSLFDLFRRGEGCVGYIRCGWNVVLQYQRNSFSYDGLPFTCKTCIPYDRTKEKGENVCNTTLLIVIIFLFWSHWHVGMWNSSSCSYFIYKTQKRLWLFWAVYFTHISIEMPLAQLKKHNCSLQPRLRQ